MKFSAKKKLNQHEKSNKRSFQMFFEKYLTTGYMLNDKMQSLSENVELKSYKIPLIHSKPISKSKHIKEICKNTNYYVSKLIGYQKANRNKSSAENELCTLAFEIFNFKIYEFNVFSELYLHNTKNKLLNV